MEKLLCAADACRAATSALCLHRAAHLLRANLSACEAGGEGSAGCGGVDPCALTPACGSQGVLERAVGGDVLVGTLVQALVESAGPDTPEVTLCQALRWGGGGVVGP